MKIAELQFNKHPILGNLHLDFRKKDGTIYETIVFVGENGCGKTTILNEIKNYNTSEYIVNKKAVVTTIGAIRDDKVNAIFLPQDIKYKDIVNTIASKVKGTLVFKNKCSYSEDNKMLLSMLAKQNIINSKDGFIDSLNCFNNKRLTNYFKNETKIENLLKKGTSLVGITSGGIDKSYIDTYCSGEQELLLKLNTLKDDINLATDIILIDEIETGLHPKWQLMIIEYLKKIIKHADEDYLQFFIATHSENILKSVINNDESLIIRLYKENNIIKQQAIAKMDKALSIISFAEVQYLVFDIPTTDYHNQLYGHLQAILNEQSIKKVDNWIKNNNIYKQEYNKPYLYEYIDKKGERKQTPYNTLPTYIRNAIHHPEDMQLSFNECELRQSIEFLRQLIKSLA